MTVYTIHRLSKDQPEATPMEQFPSVERASVALQTRARRQASPAYFMDGDPTAPRPDVAFPGADLTGYMVVWRRKGTDMPPRPDESPDELWWLTDGGAVRREPWDEGRHRMPDAPVHSAVSPQLDEEHPELKAAEAEFVSEAHPGHGAVCISYWLNGRMEMKDVRSGSCDCGDEEAHAREVKIVAKLVGPEAFNLPSAVQVWYVRSGAPDADGARKLARTVAKGLGFDMNPALAEMVNA